MNIKWGPKSDNVIFCITSFNVYEDDFKCIERIYHDGKKELLSRFGNENYYHEGKNETIRLLNEDIKRLKSLIFECEQAIKKLEDINESY